MKNLIGNLSVIDVSSLSCWVELNSILFLFLQIAPVLYFMSTLCLGCFLSEMRLFISPKVTRTDERIIPTCAS